MRVLTPLIALALAHLAVADEVRIESARDGTLYEIADGSLANGMGAHMFAGVTANEEVRRCLMTFAVTDRVPKGSTVNSVTLELFMSKTIAGAHDFAFHRVTADWGEGASDALLEEGTGAPSEEDDATWIHTFHADEIWTNPGGDFAPAPSGVFSIDIVGKYFITSPGMLADVQAWVDQTQEDLGWILKQVDESIATTAKRFGTRESGSILFVPTLVIDYTPADIGTSYCGPAVDNSTAAPGQIRALGSNAVADNSVFLRAFDLPPNQFGYFLNSPAQGLIQNPGGSQGNLCLSGAIGRYVQLAASSGPAGVVEIKLDLAHTPTPTGPVAVQPGETWNFTCWFRDVNPTSTSNFTDGVSVKFQ